MENIKRRLIGMSVALLVVAAVGMAAKSNIGSPTQASSMIKQVEVALQSLENLDQMAR